MGEEKSVEFYDRAFANNPSYSLPPEQTHYYPMWQAAIQILGQRRPPVIKDMACGPGQFALLVAQQDFEFLTSYHGTDFSSQAVKMAQENVSDTAGFTFEQADLRGHEFESDNSIFYIFLEFLEHVDFDLELMEALPSRTWLLCSLPNFDNPGHVRYFRWVRSIKKRYGHLLEFHDIQVFKQGRNRWRLCLCQRK